MTIPEYTIITLLSFLTVLWLDQKILKTKLFFTKKYYLLITITLVLQFVVDNYLNGRWWNGSFIVGPYDPRFYSGLKIWHTPVENFIYGQALIGLNVVLFEKFSKKD
jgi:hypothetical protein